MPLDVVRGIAILLMIIYHFSWDLTFFGLADFHIFDDPYWIWFAKFIAALILLVMGVSHAMARTKGVNVRAFVKRLAIISTCAIAVSTGTYLIDPNTFVYFGVLHLIAVASILLLPLASLPSRLLILLAILFLAAPQFLNHEVFSPPWLSWVGLWPTARMSVDYLPVFPWLGLPILGMVLGRWLLIMDEHFGFLKWQSRHPLIRAPYIAGRYSLLIYMIHQPILFASLYGLLWIAL
jgi:uncharacterized membrane protein